MGNTRHPYEKNEPTLGSSGGGVHGKVCWLIAYKKFKSYSVKLGKAAGIDGLSAEHFVCAHTKIRVHLALLFTAMLTHGHMSSDLMKTAIVPILRNRQGDTSDKNNYRPIAIVTAMSKILELCIMKLIETHLLTSDNQVRFKRQHGTDLCIFTVKSVIKYYNLCNSLVFT